MFIKRKKIKLNGKDFNISVYTYFNKRLRLKCQNNNESHDITINLPDIYLDYGKVFLDPAVVNNGVLNILKKKKIVKDICSTINYNYVNIPIATLNLGILCNYDYIGVQNYVHKVMSNGK